MASYSNGLTGCLRKSSAYARRRTAIAWSVILLVGLIVIFLTGCAGRPTLPTRPTIEARTNTETKELCFDVSDATSLGVYIKDLEACCAQ